MFTAEEHLVDIFSGINDESRPPTSTKAGNASHLIAKHNDFVYSLQAVLNSLSLKKDGQCVITSTGHFASAGERVVVVDDGVNDNGLYIPAVPAPGTEIFFLHVPQGKLVTIRSDDNAPFLYKGTVTPELRFVPVFEFASLIYIGQPTGIEVNFGWVPSNDTAFVASAS